MSTVIPLSRRGNLTATIISEIKAWMGRRGVNQTELAVHLGMVQSQLSRRLKGTTRITADEIEAIAEYLDVDPVVFLRPSVTPWPDGPEPPTPPQGRQAVRDPESELERAARRHHGGAPTDTHRYSPAAA